MQEVHTTLQPGTIIRRRYVVEDVLGQRSFGTVYLARDQRNNQKLLEEAPSTAVTPELIIRAICASSITGAIEPSITIAAAYVLAILSSRSPTVTGAVAPIRIS